MFDDDLEPRKQKPAPKNLDNHSIEELEAYIVELKEEIARAENEIKKKQAHRDAASTFFKS